MWLLKCVFTLRVGGNHSCSVKDSHSKLCALRVRCVEVNLAEGGNPTG